MLESLKDWFYEWGEIITMFLIVVIVSALLIVVVGYSIARPSCERMTQDMGIDSRWSLWGGCQVEVESGRWIPLDNWYYTENK